MTEEKKVELIEEILSNFKDYQIKEAWNIKCDARCESDEYIHEADEADNNYFDGLSARDVHDEFDLSDFDWEDYYFTYDEGWSALHSFNDPRDVIDENELAQFAFDNDEDFCNSEIREILDNEDEEEEEDEQTDDWSKAQEDITITLTLTKEEADFVWKALNVLSARIADARGKAKDDSIYEMSKECSRVQETVATQMIATLNA